MENQCLLDDACKAACNQCCANEGGGAVLHAGLALKALAIQKDQAAEGDDETKAHKKDVRDEHGCYLAFELSSLRCRAAALPAFL